jgi:hypothetical protein
VPERAKCRILDSNTASSGRAAVLGGYAGAVYHASNSA